MVVLAKVLQVGRERNNRYSLLVKESTSQPSNAETTFCSKQGKVPQSEKASRAKYFLQQKTMRTKTP
jgi:hypothetical protein